jgi:hypothetical protein
MQLTGHKTRAVFERYNVVSSGDLREAAQRPDSYTSAAIQPTAFEILFSREHDRTKGKLGPFTEIASINTRLSSPPSCPKLAHWSCEAQLPDSTTGNIRRPVIGGALGAGMLGGEILMAKGQQNIELKVAVCADSSDDQAALRAYVKARGWKASGRVYRFEQWRELLADATARKFNTVCATHGGLRWLAQVAPETDFPRPQPKPKSKSEPAMFVSDDADQPVIIERARALTNEKPQSEEAIAESLIAEGLLTGTLAGAAGRVRQALLRSGEFSAMEAGVGQAMLWRPWTQRVKSVDEPDGTRIIHTEVLSTTGIPVHIAIPIKLHDVARMLLEEAQADTRRAQQGEKPSERPTNSD